MADTATVISCKKAKVVWDATCLRDRLREGRYFSISKDDVSDQQLLEFVKENTREIATLLSQIEYGWGLQDWLLGTPGTPRVLAAEAGLVESLTRARRVLGLLETIAKTLEALRSATALQAVSISLSALSRILEEGVPIRVEILRSKPSAHYATSTSVSCVIASLRATRS